MISVRKTGMGIEVSIGYVTDLGSDKNVFVTVDREAGTINPSMAGSLNAAGIEALKDAIALAEMILKYGIKSPDKAN